MGPLVTVLACSGAPDAPPPRVEPTEAFPGERGAPPTAQVATARQMWDDLAAERHPADGGGRLWAVGAPDAVEAGSWVELHLVYEAGPLGVAEGGALYLLPSPFWGWSEPQDIDPGGVGYTEVQGPEGMTLETAATAGLLVVTVRGRALAPGEQVRFLYGAGGQARADRFAERGPAIHMGVDGDGDGVRALVPDPVELSVTAGPPARLVATLPSTAAPGADVPLVVAVLDELGNAFRPVELTLRIEAAASVVAPTEVTLRPEDQGVFSVPVRAEPGVVVLQVTGPQGLHARTNPMVVRAEAPRILWGDLQIHSGLSDGTGSPDQVWRYAKEVAALDFAAITDHDHWGLGFVDATPEVRERLDRAVASADEPGRFVAVHGYEWTSWLYGHRHVLYFDGAGPVRSSMDEATDTPEELREAVRGRRALIVPHHVAGGPVALDWSRGLDPELEPVVEIASVHGQSEDPSLPGAIYNAVPGTFAVDQLARGLRFGLIGSTDGHDGHPGLAQLVGGQGGLVAVEAEVATADAVHGALLARRTYATNGPRIVLRVDVGGHPMGSVVPAHPTELEVRVVGTDLIDRVELVGREGVVGSRRGDGTALVHAVWPLGPVPGDYVYVRVVQVDGGLAWSSPVFFDPAGR